MMNIDCLIEELNYYANNVTIAKDDEQIEAHKMVEESWYRDYQALTPGGPNRDYQVLALWVGPGRDYQALAPRVGWVETISLSEAEKMKIFRIAGFHAQKLSRWGKLA